jgi:hypothetical protein
VPVSRALLALLLCSAAARAVELQPVIARPITLPRGAVEVTLHGTYTNWASGVLGSNSYAGETLALGLDFGATDQVQLGLGVALPINPGAGFGSVLGTAALAANQVLAVRVDAGYESIGANGDNTAGTSHFSRYFAGLGAPLKVPISPTLAFVSGHVGTIHFGHFNNIGRNGTGFYFGSTVFTETGSDVFVFSAGDKDSGSYVGINLPFGLLLQPDPVIALTLLAGYSATISIPSSGSSETLHFLPVGLEAVVTAAPALDIGLRFSIDGYVAHSGGGGGVEPGYFDMRALMFWLRLHA